MKQAQTLTNTQQYQCEVEEDTPELGDVVGAKDGEICWYQLCGKSVNLVAWFLFWVQLRIDNSDSS